MKMVNPINVGNILLENLKQEFGEVPDSPRSEEEDDLAKHLLYTIKNAVSDVTGNLFKVENDEDTLETQEDFDFFPFGDDQAAGSEECNTAEDPVEDEDFDANEDENNGNVARAGTVRHFEDPDYVFEEDEPRKPSSYSMDYMKRVVECYNKYGLKRTCYTFKRIKHQTQVYRFKKLLENDGTKCDKYRKVKDEILKKYNAAKLAGVKVQDKDLQKWGQEVCKQLGFDSTFKISLSWVCKFKQANNISFTDKKSEQETLIVRKELLKKYSDAKAIGQKVTDKCLQKWAQDLCDEMGFEKKIGIGWVYHFKEINSIRFKEKKSEDGDTLVVAAGRRKMKKKLKCDTTAADKQSTSTKESSSSTTNLSEVQSKGNDTIPKIVQMPIIQKPDGNFQTPIPTWSHDQSNSSSGLRLAESIASCSSGVPIPLIPPPPHTLSQDAWSQMLFPVEDPRSFHPVTISTWSLVPPYDASKSE